MQEIEEKVEMLNVEEYIAPLGFDLFDAIAWGSGGGKGRNNCKTDCR